MEIVFNSSKELDDFLTKVKPITHSLDIGFTDAQPLSGNIVLKIDSNKINLSIRTKGVPEDDDSEQSSQVVTDDCATTNSDHIGLDTDYAWLDMLYDPEDY